MLSGNSFNQQAVFRLFINNYHHCVKAAMRHSDILHVEVILIKIAETGAQDAPIYH
jgi:hypothetical protein